MVRSTAYAGRDIYGERSVDVSMGDERLLQSQMSAVSCQRHSPLWTILTRSKTIQNCLNEHCGLRTKDFALLALRHDGKIETVLSPGLNLLKPQIFPLGLVRELEHGGTPLAREGFLSPSKFTLALAVDLANSGLSTSV